MQLAAGTAEMLIVRAIGVEAEDNGGCVCG
jgi:hypothetical protein